MHRDRDVDPELPAWNEADLTRDLELDTLLAAMAGDDEFRLGVARRALLASLDDADEIRYRQRVLGDFLAEPGLLSSLYDVAVEAVVLERQRVLSRLFDSPENTLHRATLDLTEYVGLLRRLRAIADERASGDHVGGALSDGLSRFFSMLREELDDAYFAEVEDHLRHLDFRNDVRMSVGLGADLDGDDYVLHKPAPAARRRWFERLGGRAPTALSYAPKAGDERGLRALGELRVRGVDLVADALAQSTEHILSFFQSLRSELGFYVGCVALRDALASRGQPTCFPALGGTGLTLAGEGIYDPSLALTTPEPVVGQDVRVRDARIVVVTGANQGGKSTFLRSVGIAHLMARAGMFVPAASLELNVSTGLFTHFRREEDATMVSGKLDEEFTRMSAIVDHLSPGALVLFNESFAATNEREGSHLSREILRALLEAGVTAVFVTHLYALAHALHADGTPGAVFLRAPREVDGRRTFRLIEGEPLPTSFGRDLYERVFGARAN